MTISIWGRYKNNKPEVVDRASSEREANYLVGEYRMAFGKDWTIWSGRRDAERGEEENERSGS